MGVEPTHGGFAIRCPPDATHETPTVSDTAENHVALCGALSAGETAPKPADKPAPEPAGDVAPIDDHLEGIIATIRRLLPEAEQAELVRRLGNPRPDPGLTAIVAAWPKLPAGARSGLVAAAEAFAKAPEP